ncbi:MAG: hypothetical protein AVDCRST_MAG77-2763 [uncultured Chloroflexi bacterium]|uniref:Blue (type 1) copper domain-containing protein n=1 Tax=uncultured Chloroflexota bacterium TaxID=166587 RepID=A0A6J4IYZ5_9CHLR|nr:MAG: hypothetical protein AVDCRST_MAG77-2763 [uncultured Chloroflexota bacterium]
MPAIRNNDIRFAAGRRSRLCVLCAPGVLAAALLVSCGAAQPRAVTVTTQAFRFQPSALEWQAGQTIRFTLRNPDGVEHDFVVDALRVTAASGDGHAQHGPGAGPAPSPGSLHVHAAAFSEASATFTPQSKGTYTVYCSIPSHKELGMVASLVVK